MPSTNPSPTRSIAYSLTPKRKLCDRCATLTSDDFLRVEVNGRTDAHWLGPTTGDLSKHFHDGTEPACCLCAMVLRALIKSGEIEGDLGRKIALRFVGTGRKVWNNSDLITGLGIFVQRATSVDFDSSGPCKVVLRVHSSRRRLPASVISSFAVSDRIERQLLHKPVYRDTLSALSIARDWLQDCLDHNEHAPCSLDFGGKSVRESLFDSERCMPGRVLEVSSNGSMKLVETGRRKGVYCALSYCWGQIDHDSVLKLTRQNMESMKRNIPVELLPKTIKDAAFIAQQLWIPYLWIDSLCIIQGDEDDWEKEGGRMAEIYQNAILTLGVLGDRTASTGILDRAIPDLSVKIPYSLDSQDVRSLIVSDHSPLKEANTTQLDDEIWASPWGKRGWTFQEQHLSRRILYFGHHQLYWECHTQGLSEDGVDEYRFERIASFFMTVFLEQGISEAVLASLRQVPHIALEEGDGIFSSLAAKAWSQVLKTPVGHAYIAAPRWIERRLVQALKFDSSAWMGFNLNAFLQNYTSRILSNENDKLIAIEGLASAIAQQSKQKFFAGIFTNHVAKGLFWSSADGNMRRPQIHRAPSWSWAAWAGQMRLCAAHWNDEARSGDRDSEGERNYLSHIPEMQGGRLGDLLHAEFERYNHTVSNVRGARPYSISLKCLSFRTTRSAQTVADFPLTSAQLDEDIQIWPKGFYPWPKEQTHLLFTATQGVDEMETLSNAERIDTSNQSCYGTGRRLIGVARFDEPHQAPMNCAAILLWHYRHPSVIFSRYGCKTGSDASDILSCKGSLKSLDIPHSKKELDWSKAVRQSPRANIKRWKRTYFLLLVDRAVPDPTGKIARPFKRVGVAIAYWIPEMPRFGGLDLKALAKEQEFVLV